MKVQVVVFMKKAEKFYENAAAEYEKRLNRYCKVRIRRLSPGTPMAQPEEFCVLVEPEGEPISSEELARRIAGAQVRGVSRVCVVLPAEGEDPARGWSRQPMRLSLSALPLSPGLTLTVVLEQIYRAFKIINGETYHK